MFTDSLSIIVMTVKISIYDHVFKASEPEIVEYSSVAEWILDNKKDLLILLFLTVSQAMRQILQKT